MATSIRVTALAAVIGACLGGNAWVNHAHATNSGDQTANAVNTYIIKFTDAGALHYKGGVANLRATAPDPNARASKFDAASADTKNYRAYLRERQQDSIATMSSLLGHPLEVTHTYEITDSGIAARLTAAEAAKIANAPGVASVKQEEIYHLDTYRGPIFIGADTVWNQAIPGGAKSRGKGVVVGVLDTGVNSTHPSFADDATCGFGPSDHKLLSAVDCATSTAGVCNGPDPEAVASGHGVHTASTAAGNTVTNSASPSPNLPVPYTQMSGVAPCASLRTYKVCATDQCSSSAISAGIQNAIIDGVDVINYSISGGTNPWADSDRAFLDAVNTDIVVAASAGNTNATITNPVGQVNHRGPWVMTVAASTQDVNLGAGVSATGPGTPPADTQNLLAALGSHMTTAVPFTNKEIRVSATNLIGCTAGGAFPANFFNGAVALIQRGTCPFTEKVANAAAAGADQVIIYNNTFGTINMNTDGATIPAYSITQAAGVAMNSFITSNGSTPTTASLEARIAGPVQPDVLADFSFRGPTPGNLADLTKPDITGPGVSIYAAGRAADGNYYSISGTSMSSPHLAGSAALVRAVNPDWTPTEVKSALQLTAKITGTKEDESTPWDIDDVGNGRVDLSAAPFAGFVMDETYANFLAANPSGGSINVKELNLPSVRVTGLSNVAPAYTWVRHLRNTSSEPTTWNVTVDQPPGVTVTVAPTTFTFTGAGIDNPEHIFTGDFETTAPPVAPETVTIFITATTTAATTGIAFGEVKFTEVNADAPPAHITVAVKRQ
ncbi:MAG TPA: S8 family serine peptidase [Dokdonella sp.]|uniref:S8 family serine peptidase n=1 Tax=Dokdonella sp. TaxID=2291710 RepID=UPI002D8015DF|nr:S8 family serine peptidase [Dokdonella sp.]HET9033058.1 S8 family serine peptidase [Dokdonella sp.]